MEWLDNAVVGFLGAHAVLKSILGTAATILGYGRAKAWWNQKNGPLGDGGNSNFKPR